MVLDEVKALLEAYFNLGICFEILNENEKSFDIY